METLSSELTAGETSPQDLSLLQAVSKSSTQSMSKSHFRITTVPP